MAKDILEQARAISDSPEYEQGVLIGAEVMPKLMNGEITIDEARKLMAPIFVTGDRESLVETANTYRMIARVIEAEVRFRDGSSLSRRA